jgi:hypothetical protein
VGISGSEKGELKDALAALEGKVALHGALKKGFLSIYGYTSAADGSFGAEARRGRRQGSRRSGSRASSRTRKRTLAKASHSKAR